MLLRQAFVSPSLTDASQNRIQNYQLLEFVGDAVLGLSVVKNLVSEFCHIDEKGQFVSLATEGHLTQEKTRLVKNQNLALCSATLGFDSYLERAHGHRSHDHKNKKGDLIEAVLGAIAIDSDWNMEILSQVAMQILKHNSVQENATEKLQNYCVKKMIDSPTFSFWSSEGEHYDCVISLPLVDEVFAGNGKSPEEAQNMAAEMAYNFLTEQPSAVKKNKAVVTENSLKKLQTPVEQLNLKFIKKEISKPFYSFTKTTENNKLVWICSLTLNDNTHRTSGKANSCKKAKQAAAQVMLKLLENSVSIENVQGVGLLKRAMMINTFLH